MKKSKILKNIIFSIVLLLTVIISIEVVKAWALGEQYTLWFDGNSTLKFGGSGGQRVYCTNINAWGATDDVYELSEYCTNSEHEDCQNKACGFWREAVWTMRGATGKEWDMGSDFSMMDSRDMIYTVHKHITNEKESDVQQIFWKITEGRLLKAPGNHKIEVGTTNPTYAQDTLIGPYKITVSGLETGDKIDTSNLVTITYKSGATEKAKILASDKTTQISQLTKNETIEVYLKLTKTEEITDIKLTYKEASKYWMTFYVFRCVKCGKQHGNQAPSNHQTLIGVQTGEEPGADKNLPLKVPTGEKVPFNLSKKDLEGNYISGIDFKITPSENNPSGLKASTTITTSNKDILVDTLAADGKYEYWITELAESATKADVKTPRTLSTGENTDFAIRVTLTKTGDDIKVDEVMLPYNPDTGVDAPKVNYTKTNKTLTVEWKNRKKDKDIPFYLLKTDTAKEPIEGIEFTIKQTRGPSGIDMVDKTSKTGPANDPNVLIDKLTVDGTYEYWITEKGESAKDKGYKTPRTDNGNIDYGVKIVLEKKGDQITVIPCNWSGCNGGNSCGKEVHVTYNPDEGANAPKINKETKTLTLEWENRKNDDYGFKIYKYDKDTNEPVKGAVFDIVGGTVDDEYNAVNSKGVITGENGEIVVLEKLSEGDYSFKITETGIRENNSNYSDAQLPIEITLAFSVDANGKITFAPGQLYLVKGPTDLKPTFDKDTGILKWPNKKSGEGLKIKKYDQDTEEPVEGATFNITFKAPVGFDKNDINEAIRGKVLNASGSSTYQIIGVKTNAQGEIIVLDRLIDGVYNFQYVEETDVEEPYSKALLPIKVGFNIGVQNNKIKTCENLSVQPLEAHELDIDFDVETGTLKWPNKKGGEVKLELLKVVWNDNQAPLDEAEFDVSITKSPQGADLSKVVTGSGKRTADGGVLKLGTFVTEGIYEVTLKETATPTGYVIAESLKNKSVKVTFEIKDGKVLYEPNSNGTPKTPTLAIEGVANYDYKGAVNFAKMGGEEGNLIQVRWANTKEAGFKIYKYDKEDMSKPIQGATFTIECTEKPADAKVEAGGVTNSVGELEILKELVPGKYTFKLTETNVTNNPEYFLEAPITITLSFEVKDNGEVVVLTPPTGGPSDLTFTFNKEKLVLNWPNKKRPEHKFIIKKLAIPDNIALPNVQFSISVSPSTSVMRNGSAFSGTSGTTSAAGEIAVDKLIFTMAGTYEFTITETRLAGYKLPDGSQTGSYTFKVTINVDDKGNISSIQSSATQNIEATLTNNNLDMLVTVGNEKIQQNISGAIEGRVWEDIRLGKAGQHNGRFDGAEVGMAGVKVELWAIDTYTRAEKLCDTKTTGSDGKYAFTIKPEYCATPTSRAHNTDPQIDPNYLIEPVATEFYVKFFYDGLEYAVATNVEKTEEYNKAVEDTAGRQSITSAYSVMNAGEGKDKLSDRTIFAKANTTTNTGNPNDKMIAYKQTTPSKPNKPYSTYAYRMYCNSDPGNKLTNGIWDNSSNIRVWKETKYPPDCGHHTCWWNDYWADAGCSGCSCPGHPGSHNEYCSKACTVAHTHTSSCPKACTSSHTWTDNCQCAGHYRHHPSACCTDYYYWEESWDMNKFTKDKEGTITNFSYTNVNLALIKRDQLELELVKDLDSVIVDINGQRSVYSAGSAEPYGKMGNAFEGAGRKDIAGNETEDQFFVRQTGDYELILRPYINLAYDRSVLPSDYNYRIGAATDKYGTSYPYYDITKPDHLARELEIYVDYRIIIRNNSPRLTAAVTELVDYYSSALEPVGTFTIRDDEGTWGRYANRYDKLKFCRIGGGRL